MASRLSPRPFHGDHPGAFALALVTGRSAKGGDSVPLLRRLQQRWGLSPWRVVAVLAAFSLAGSTTVLLKRPITGWLLSPDTPPWQQWVIYLVVVVPLYHLLLLTYGALLGQYDFFRDRLRDVARRMTGRGASPGHASDHDSRSWQ